MIIGDVVGNIWATKKEESLNGLKLMIVKRVDSYGSSENESFVAVDFVGAGIGDKVLVTTGSSARISMDQPNSPVDAAIVGIIDEVEVMGEEKNKHVF
ncbi:MAG: EutN/CcmL family microcompartment protein [Desulfobacterales bacterium]|nr:EutN/CcmL family microcompartment protein [Desulfobacterales bacterium]